MKLIRRSSLFSIFALIVLAMCSSGIIAQETVTQITKNKEVVEKETVNNKVESTKEDSTTTKPTENNSLETNTEYNYSNENLINRVGVQTTQNKPLTLDEAIRQALQNNNDIEIARDDVKIAELTLRSLEGVFDGVFTFNPNLDRNSITGRDATTDIRINSDFTRQLENGGGNYRAFFNNSRTENSFAQAQVSSGSLSNAGNSALYSSSLGVTFTQPLWRNLKIDNNRRQIKIQRKRIAQSDTDFRRRTIEIIAQVQRSYWDLVFALRDQQNRVANLNLSKENLRQVEARIEAGAAAPLQRAEVNTELANRESDVLIAAQQVATAENALKQLLLKDADSPEWVISYVPTDSPVFSLDPVNLDLSLQDAIANRPELSRLRLENDITNVDIDYFKNQTKPRIDLNTTASLDGFASQTTVGTQNIVTNFFTSASDLVLFNGLNDTRAAIGLPPISNQQIVIPASPSFLIGGYPQALSNIFRSDAPNFSVGLIISFPFKNKTAKANLAVAQTQKNRLDAQTRLQEQTIVAEVRNAVQAVETARLRVLTARKARENAEIQLEGERKLYDVGRSTTFLLFQRENTLANARNAVIRAETDYNKALADLQRATSTTFRANNIVVDSPSDDNN
ncbi:MAG: TolC family protein [Aridibacter sp.]